MRADKMVARCKLGELLPHATRVVTVGAAMWKGPLVDAASDLSKCGDVTMIAGRTTRGTSTASDHYVKRGSPRAGACASRARPLAAHELVFDALRDQLFLQTSTTD